MCTGNQVVWAVSTGLERRFFRVAKLIIKIINFVPNRDASKVEGSPRIQSHYVFPVDGVLNCVNFASLEEHITSTFEKLIVDTSGLTSKVAYLLKFAGAYVAFEWTCNGRH